MKVNETLESVLGHILINLKVREIRSATHRTFNSFLGVWKCSQTRSLVYDILHTLQLIVPWLSIIQSCLATFGSNRFR